MKTRFLIIFLLSGYSLFSQVQVRNLRCEMMKDPMGIDVVQPRFSWQLESGLRDVHQVSYQLLVSSTEENLQKDRGDVWNSGLITDSHSLLINYNGMPLQTGGRYYWKVKVITNKGEATLKEKGMFSMGLLSSGDWKAKWIGYDKASPWDSVTQWSRLSARYLRKEFISRPAIKRATVYIVGLGMYELFINGNRVGDQVLAPNPTDYRKSFFYNTHDVTSIIKNGNNAIATVLGNGRFFTMRQNYKTQKHNTFGFPKLLFQLEIEYQDGSKKIITSDETWKLNVDGPIRTNNEYDGEEYDARKEFGPWMQAGFDDKNWMKAELVQSPSGHIVSQLSAPMKVMKFIKPVSIKPISGNRYILDMGQNFAGRLKITVAGARGQQIKLRFAESLQTNGELFTANLRDAKVTDIYILRGAGFATGKKTETWAPSFVYHGFRYVEVSGFTGTPTLNDFEGQMIYDDLETTGSFESSNSTLNAIYRNAWWGIASNYKGMPVDCPQRNERQPWLGDRAVGAQGESYVFNNAKLYAKWMEDIEQAQTMEGSIPDVAPAFWNYYSDNVTWPATYITITNNLYNQFGDIKPIQQHYASMKKWIMYMKSKYMVNNIMTKDKYGDWCVPPESLQLIHAKDTNRLTDGKLIATAYFYKLLTYLQRFARLTGNNEDVKEISALAEAIRVAFHQTFYNPQAHYYSNNTVTANLLPLYFGICPDSLKERVFENIYKKIHEENKDHISTGLIGTQYLMRGLTEYGQTDLAFTLASNKTYPSWGYMIENGATTIWELWNGNTADPNMNSQNHVMLLGDLLTWYYENLAGIRTDKTEVGFKRITMKPSIPKGLEFVKGSYNSPYGLIKSDWNITGDQFTWQVSIPANTTATLYIPAIALAGITENGKDISGPIDGIQVKEWNGNALIVEIGSGTYQFKSTVKLAK